MTQGCIIINRVVLIVEWIIALQCVARVLTKLGISVFIFQINFKVVINYLYNPLRLRI